MGALSPFDGQWVPRLALERFGVLAKRMQSVSRQAPMRPAEVLLFVSCCHKDDYWMQALMPLLQAMAHGSAAAPI
jgi:hypothetical protein